MQRRNVTCIVILVYNPDIVDPSMPWILKGISDEAREFAKLSADKPDVPVGACLSQVIRAGAAAAPAAPSATEIDSPRRQLPPCSLPRVLRPPQNLLLLQRLHVVAAQSSARRRSWTTLVSSRKAPRTGRWAGVPPTPFAFIRNLAVWMKTAHRAGSCLKISVRLPTLCPRTARNALRADLADIQTQT